MGFIVDDMREDGAEGGAFGGFFGGGIPEQIQHGDHAPAHIGGSDGSGIGLGAGGGLFI